MPYISITGLSLHTALHWPRFMWHASRSLQQARQAAGNLSAEARQIRGVHHTLSVWKTRAHMLAYLRTGPHLTAMRMFPKLGHGRTAGYEADAAPDWERARRYWEEHSVDVSRPASRVVAP